MIRRVPIRRSAAVLFAALLAACDGGSTTPRVLGEMRIVSGDHQTAKVGTRLADALVVEVLDDRGEPIPGVHIAWDVPIGSATLSSTRTVTGGNGRTSVQATLTVSGQSAIHAVIDEPIDQIYEVYFVADATL
jgi:hypothetical protein